jgi:hypothetical protein
MVGLVVTGDLWAQRATADARNLNWIALPVPGWVRISWVMAVATVPGSDHLIYNVVFP